MALINASSKFIRLSIVNTNIGVCPFTDLAQKKVTLTMDSNILIFNNDVELGGFHFSVHTRLSKSCYTNFEELGV